ncbi:hypothetical protein Bca4012_043053 [Brassica carinata]
MFDAFAGEDNEESDKLGKARPPPVITEEVTASLEDMIKSRIIEARFDDVQRAPSLPTKSKREAKELVSKHAIQETMPEAESNSPRCMQKME